MSQQRKKFPPESRREAANLVIEAERPIAHVAQELGVSAGLLGRWVKLERERRGSSDGMSESDLFADLASQGYSRVRVDGATVEVYADGGQVAMGSRVYFEKGCSDVIVETSGDAVIEQSWQRKGSKL